MNFKRFDSLAESYLIGGCRDIYTYTDICCMIYSATTHENADAIMKEFDAYALLMDVNLVTISALRRQYMRYLMLLRALKVEIGTDNV